MKRETEIVTLQIMESPLGQLLIGATDSHLILLEFASSSITPAKVRLPDGFSAEPSFGSNPVIQQTMMEVNEYFAGKRKEFTIPLHFPGTPFQIKVWRALLKVPYGSTCSYQDIAKRVTRSPQASRAVGRANGTNRICIVIPCHRVCNKGGGIGGYGGGIPRKEALLKLEQQNPA